MVGFCAVLRGVGGQHQEHGGLGCVLPDPGGSVLQALLKLFRHEIDIDYVVGAEGQNQQFRCVIDQLPVGRGVVPLEQGRQAGAIDADAAEHHPRLFAKRGHAKQARLFVVAARKQGQLLCRLRRRELKDAASCGFFVDRPAFALLQIQLEGRRIHRAGVKINVEAQRSGNAAELVAERLVRRQAITDESAQTGGGVSALVMRLTRAHLAHDPLRAGRHLNGRCAAASGPPRRQEADAAVAQDVLQALAHPVGEVPAGRMRIPQLQDPHRLAVRADQLLAHALREVPPVHVAAAFDPCFGLRQLRPGGAEQGRKAKTREFPPTGHGCPSSRENQSVKCMSRAKSRALC